MVHGYQSGDDNGCKSEWPDDIGSKIRHLESETVTVKFCWDSIGHYRNGEIFRSNDAINLTGGGVEKTMQGRFDLSTCISDICLNTYNFNDPYYTNACSTAKLGELMAKIVTAIRQEFSNIEYIHGIGHSLGAHILGNIEKFGNVKLDRISGLDPTGPCFEDQSSDVRFNFGSWGLTDSSADFVDNIHTDGLAFGTSLPKGHSDFYAGKTVSVSSIFLTKCKLLLVFN